MEHSTDAQKEQATELWNYWLVTNNYPECTSRAQELGYGSVYQARAVLERLGLPKEHMLELNAVRPGELALATVPGEIFDTCGAYGYFTTMQACEYGRYEADTRKYAKGSAEEMVENLVEMLYELSKQEKGLSQNRIFEKFYL